MQKSKFLELTNRESDINYHLQTLRYFSNQCDSIVEMGVRWIVSTWAFLDAKPKKLTSYDINHPNTWQEGELRLNECKNFARENNIEFNFIQDDVLKVNIEETDLLFLDTWHVYDQLKKELKIHSSKVKKYIILHDTVTFGETGETEGYKGINYAINEFLIENEGAWRLYEHYTFNNGLTVLRNEKTFL